jgi:hypothetical protein
MVKECKLEMKEQDEGAVFEPGEGLGFFLLIGCSQGKRHPHQPVLEVDLTAFPG